MIIIAMFFHAGDGRPADEEGDGLEQVDQLRPGSCLALPAATIDIDMVRNMMRKYMQRK